MYTETTEYINAAAQKGWDEAERTCGEAWTSHSDAPDATPVATPATGRIEVAAVMQELRSADHQAE